MQKQQCSEKSALKLDKLTSRYQHFMPKYTSAIQQWQWLIGQQNDSFTENGNYSDVHKDG